ncbi:MAG TPA: glucosaminidase domain-containing protein [Pseudomonadales bacterium]|jgi:uncharacterized FlgJ-related protein
MKHLVLCLLFTLCLGCSKSESNPPADAAQAATAQPAHQTFEFHSYEELDAFFKKHQYGPEYWKDGDHSVPRFYLTEIPPRWGKSVSPHLTVQDKKRGFFFVLAPLVLSANERIEQDRQKLETLLAAQHSSWSAADSQWLQALATRYGAEGDITDSTTQQTLLRRVDTIPTSLVLAQAATESGWGTSRFASEGNALFGQWTWGGKGIKPTEQRTATKGNYKVQSFDTPRDSVSAYLLNLNTGLAYTDLRTERMKIRQQKKPLTGIDLAEGLLKYSERGQAYVDELRALIRYNQLQATDDATLRDMEPVWITPVGEGAH